ncbi:polysaccharide deacetylase family protein [Candidatus Sumerlaeota bacterium]|nr:polysaccharide deacetylase family protein [Candidatus Sumerlaeota bacterium]
MFGLWKASPLALSALCGLLFSQGGCAATKSELTWVRGGIERGPLNKKTIALEFTGGSFGEGGGHILSVLKKHGLKASFFFTGDFFRTPEFDATIKAIVMDGHYLGIHSDTHPLYCPWDNRDKTLVSREDFVADIRAAQEYLIKYGVDPKKNRYWIPPYEWYNEDISRWSEELGLILINFSPGSYSNADYTGEADKNFRSSDFIYQKILEKEASDPNGLNGFLLLIHIGAGPGRKDKFFLRLEPLILELKKRGYRFVRVDEMLEPFFNKS